MRSTFAASLVVAAAACSGGHHVAQPPSPSPSPSPSSSTGPSAKTVALADVGLDEAALDRSADPCDDFYQYACGSWIKNTPIPSDKPAYSRGFDIVDDRNQEYLHGLLDKLASSPPDDPVLAKLGTFYGACMDEAGIEKAGIAPIAPLLALDAKVKDGASLTAAVIELHKHGVSALWGFGSTPDFKDASQMIAGIQQGGLGLPDRDFYTRTDDQSKALLAAYEAHVATMLGFTGMKPAAATKAAHDVVALETELARASKTNVEMRDSHATYNRVERAGLAKAAPHVAWDAYFAGLGIADVKPVTASGVEFFHALDGLVATTPPATWRAYLAFHTIEDTAELLGAAPIAARFQFIAALTGQQQDVPRWKKCVRATDAALGQLLAQPYVKDRFGGDARGQAEALVKSIAAAMEQNLGSLDWMDATTRARAIEKLRAMSYQIGYPDTWRAYDFDVKRGAYADNALAGRWFEVRRDLRKIGKPVDKRDWGMTPPTVNAYYTALFNQMVFPAGILQPPFFDPHASVAVNYGGIGMVMGHELTHGFDDQGSQFDANGNLANWWAAPVGAKFKAKTQCVIDQYSGYQAVPGTNVNGALTTGENIADIGGLKLAFAAARAARAGGATPVVAGGFDEDQQFFLGFAQSWCMSAHPEILRLLAQSDPHSPPQWRVNGTLADTPEFAAAFRCKVGAKMRPANACAVW